MSDDFLPYGRHFIDEADIDAVVDVLKNGILTGGPKAAELEAMFAARVGAQHAVVVSNGTTALHLALIASEFKPGDVAIVPSVTFLSTANVVEMCGGTVVFADVDPETGLMTPDTLSQAYDACGKQASVVFPVHLTGQSEHMQEIRAFAGDAGMKVISDCCHAIGAEYKAGGSPGDGQLEDFGCYSLHPVKTIAMGEGGIITTKDAAIAERMRLLRSHDMHRNPEDFSLSSLAFDKGGTPNPWYYEMQELGYNYRATDIQCALGISQLSKLDHFVSRRRSLAGLYDGLLASGVEHVQPNRRSSDCLSAWHLYAVRIDFDNLGQDRASVMRKLAEKGVGTQVHYIPVHLQPYYQNKYGLQNLPGAEAYYARTLSLPLFPAMQDSDPERVISTLRTILAS